MFLLSFIGAVAFARADSTFGKLNGKKGLSTVVFNRYKTFFAAVIALVVCFFEGFLFNGQTLLYASLYGVFLTAANYFGVRAITEGHMGVVSMIGSFSLIVPCAYGLIFLDEKLSIFGIMGLILVFISIALLSYKKQSGALSVRCLVFSFITLIANGACSVLQKMQQTAQPNSFRAEFTLFSAVVAFLVFMVMKNTNGKKEQATSGNEVKKVLFNKDTALFGTLSGLFNGASGLLVLTLATSQNASVLFPLLSVANSVVAVVVGRVVFKEKLTAIQMISVIIGIVSVVLLKI